MIATVLLGMALQAAPATRYTGIARATANGPVLYRETHYRYGPPGDRRALVVYRCPDGRAFARKTVAPAGSSAPDFDLEEASNGYREGVRTVDGRREVYVHRVGAAGIQQARLPATRHPVIDSGFDAFVRMHFDALAAGRVLRMAFLVPSRLGFVHFRITRHRDARAAPRGVLVLRLELDRWFAFALPHIDVGYDRASRQLLWFRGLSNLRDRHGRNVRVDLRYPPAARGIPVTAAQLDAARTAPLDGRCRLD